MEKLLTPLGVICITVNGIEVNYTVENLCKVERYKDGSGYLFNVDGRCKLTPEISDKVVFPLEIECSVEKFSHIVLDDRTGAESGEYMAMWSMYNGSTKLSIGSPDDTPDYLEDCVQGSYSSTGVIIDVRNRDYLKHAFFCVAWVSLNGTDYENNGDIYTWFAADPTIA